MSDAYTNKLNKLKALLSANSPCQITTSTGPVTNAGTGISVSGNSVLANNNVWHGTTSTPTITTSGTTWTTVTPPPFTNGPSYVYGPATTPMWAQTSISSISLEFVFKDEDMKFAHEVGDIKLPRFESISSYEYKSKDNVETVRVILGANADAYSAVYKFIASKDFLVSFEEKNLHQGSSFSRITEIVSLDSIQSNANGSTSMNGNITLDLTVVTKYVLIKSQDKTEKIFI